MNQGHTGSKHQGREKLTADQSVADFQDWIAYFADVRNETSLEQCLSTLSWEAHIRVHRSTSSPLNIINFSSHFLNTFKHIPIDAPRDFSHLLYTRIASDTRCERQPFLFFATERERRGCVAHDTSYPLEYFHQVASRRYPSSLVNGDPCVLSKPPFFYHNLLLSRTLASVISFGRDNVFFFPRPRTSQL